MDSLTPLFRPIGLTELELIAESNYQKFPPRLTWQPIFYPVTNQAYAEQIAEQWNTNDAFSNYCGFVTRFKVLTDHVKSYKVRNVGAEVHNELWVPAEKLNKFNNNIIGNIAVVSAFFGKDFIMPTDSIVQDIITRFK